MEWLIAISFGELFLKGKNRNTFFATARRNIEKNIRDIGYDDIYIESSVLYIKADYEKLDIMIPEIQKVFGIIYISKVLKCEKNIDSIKEACKCVIDERNDYQNKTFKVVTKRVDKSFPLQSTQLSSMLGGYILKNYENVKVDVHKPDFKVFVDIKSKAYVYSKRYKGQGGLPLGSSGQGLLLLSGGIDSPVAGFMMAKRGMKLDAIHFHSYPFTSKRAHQKAIELAEIMSKYTGDMRVYSVNLADIYKAINENCPRNYTTILSRRFMMRIAEKISKENNYQAVVTGESLGQVASQTLESMSVIEDAIALPVLRPVIALDKAEIIEKSVEIGSYQKSIEPYDDCCSIFAPSNPITKPRIKFVKLYEENLNIEELENKAIEKMEIINI
ncbi:MAG: tRNA 4-thiouridine(8) synthase ThiI [Peptoniphilaceae bacterium]|nr:tRNA 4-thiouridine(8) synthase ThiI [Peptoniphilaceae bacterium]MDY6019590.1 tRNA uracil 4-sulfurtransferase ThiI [Anaerococcus sp.]